MVSVGVGVDQLSMTKDFKVLTKNIQYLYILQVDTFSYFIKMDLMKGKKLLKADRTSVDAEAALQGKVTVYITNPWELGSQKY